MDELSAISFQLSAISRQLFGGGDRAPTIFILQFALFTLNLLEHPSV
jgi:hypothetical protein